MKASLDVGDDGIPMKARGSIQILNPRSHVVLRLASSFDMPKEYALDQNYLNPFNPVTQRTVSRCAFDADAVLLRCGESMRLIANAGARVAGRRYVGFSPLRNALVEWAEGIVGWLPIGAQYSVWGIKTSQH